MKLFVSDKEKRTIVITENQLQILSEDGSTGFSTDTLNSIDGFKEKVQYCTSCLGKYIGAGSSRVVFKIDNKTVVKLAYNEAGYAQNKEESQWGENRYEFLPKAYESNPDGSWIISEFVLPVNESDFAQYFSANLDEQSLGMIHTFSEFCEFIWSVENSRNNGAWQFFSDRKLGILRSNRFLNEVADYIEATGVSVGDLTVIHNWGKRVSDGMPVLLDAGWKKGIGDEFYHGDGPAHLDDVMESKRVIVLSQNQVDELLK